MAQNKVNITYQVPKEISELMDYAAGRTGLSRTEIYRRLVIAFTAGDHIDGLVHLRPHKTAAKLQAKYL